MTANNETRISELLNKYNAAYRTGEALISDGEYDLLVEELRAINPDNKLLHSVEEEVLVGRKEIIHPEPMLSTQKYYIGKNNSLDNWIKSIKTAYAELGLDGKIRVTAKLDGLAGFDSGEYLATRGNGIQGYDVSKIFDLGVVPVGGRGHGVGEIVLSKSYFDEHLSEKMSHPRNVVAGIVGTDHEINPLSTQALNDGAVQFVAYNQLESILVDFDELESRAEELLSYFTSNTDFYIDGIVAEANDVEVYEHMGYTGHHRKSQIAIKTIGETAEVCVKDVVWQVGRTRITPVIHIETTNISGANVSKLSGHHAGNIKIQGIGKGATGKAVRAGEVIPTWLNTIKTSNHVSIPKTCPSCSSNVVWVGDFIECHNQSCDGKTASNLRHAINNMDILLFGKKAVETLVDNGYSKISDLFYLNENDYLAMGFGKQQSLNFLHSIENTLSKSMSDVRFVASWGIPNLGKGDSKKILENMSIDELLSANHETISSIQGFGDKTATDIIDGINKNRTLITQLMELPFNLKITQTKNEKQNLPLFGQKIVFTGKVSTPRKDLKAMAESNGADVQSGVNKKTTLLVAGEGAGSKLKKAEDLGIKIISEGGFISLI